MERMRDETKNATEVEMSTGNIERTASKVDAGTHLSEQEIVTDALLENEANTRKNERLKIGSNKFVFAKTQGKKNGVQQRIQPCLSEWAMWS